MLPLTIINSLLLDLNQIPFNQIVKPNNFQDVVQKLAEFGGFWRILADFGGFWRNLADFGGILAESCTRNLAESADVLVGGGPNNSGRGLY